MTKLEQVARAIEDAGLRWLEVYAPYCSHTLGFGDVPKEVLARAAIQAMREPTVEMIEDGADILEKYNTSYRAVRDTFRAMIDRVLAEGGE